MPFAVSERLVLSLPTSLLVSGLPPSRPAIAYYTYNNSTDFPQFNPDDTSKVLGRAAIAPFFYRYGLSVNASAPYALPQYYDNSLFFFDWFR